MCFAAGTKIHTEQGLRNIEDIVPGDIVLSRDTHSREMAFREVRQTFITHPSRLYSVCYRDSQDVNAPEDRLVYTGEHPFYVVGKNDFVPANELLPGDELSLASGQQRRNFSAPPLSESGG